MSGGGINMVREGARIDTQDIGSSSYGTKLKTVFGTVRVEGTLIYASKAVEHRNVTTTRMGGGKGGGGGKQTDIDYTYSCGLVYAVCLGPVVAVRKVWASGQLIYDASGPTVTGWAKDSIAFKLGTETQMPSTIIQAEKGALATAHRGVVLVELLDIDLTEKFGNRPPSLQVEVCQTATLAGAQVNPVPVALSDVIAGMCTRAGIPAGSINALGVSGTVSGWSVEDDYRAALERLGQAFGVRYRDDAGVLRFYSVDPLPADARSIAAEDLGADGGDEIDMEVCPVEIEDEQSLPSRLTVKYQDLARDGQSGAQRARRLSTRSTNEVTEEFDLMLTAAEASAMAYRWINRLWIERRKIGPLKLPPAYLTWVRPGVNTWVTDDAGVAHPIRIVKVGVGADFSMEVYGRSRMPSLMETPTPPASAGAVTPVAPPPLGTTSARLLNLPPLQDAAATRFGFYAAAAGSGLGWRSALLLNSVDGGTTWTFVASLPQPATLGTCKTALPAPAATIGAATFDTASTVDVEIVNPAAVLTSVTDAQLLAGANRALIANEIIQFGVATLIAPRTYRLSRLLRGRKATEAAMTGHTAADLFTLLDANVIFVPRPLSTATSLWRVAPAGMFTTSDIPDISFAPTGETLRPWPPTQLQLTRGGADGNTLYLNWKRRSRIGSELPVYGDVPLDEPQEAYVVNIFKAGAVVRSVPVNGMQKTIYSSLAQFEDFGGTPTSLTWSVAQVSYAYAMGRPTTLTGPVPTA